MRGLKELKLRDAVFFHQLAERAALLAAQPRRRRDIAMRFVQRLFNKRAFEGMHRGRFCALKPEWVPRISGRASSDVGNGHEFVNELDRRLLPTLHQRAMHQAFQLSDITRPRIVLEPGKIRRDDRPLRELVLLAVAPDEVLGQEFRIPRALAERGQGDRKYFQSIQ